MKKKNIPAARDMLCLEPLLLLLPLCCCFNALRWPGVWLKRLVYVVVTVIVVVVEVVKVMVVAKTKK